MPALPLIAASALLLVAVGEASPTSWGATLRDIGFAGGALVLVWAFYTGRVHSDREFREALEERDRRIEKAEAASEEWRRIAQGVLPVAQGAVDVARR